MISDSTISDRGGGRADAGSSGEALLMTLAVSEVSAWEYIFTGRSAEAGLDLTLSLSQSVANPK